MTIKYHYILHMPLQLDRKITCWVHERKHKTVKKFANNTGNTSSDWDKGILCDVTCAHMATLQDVHSSEPTDEPKLVEPTAPTKSLRQLWSLLLANSIFNCTICSFKQVPRICICQRHCIWADLVALCCCRCCDCVHALFRNYGR